ncbi:response regulator transcription factor [Nocardioides sp. zg-536]|uniref:Response regulator transcription factor n=1 Tax=Nocardioides faecalis TaxID=2803858 RepID=A0A938Y2R6_9ACTN|nr:response regulator transcription factor [Nocardioides faecalis]MBM9460801.1 response regulator transcription factor [Nocardioides faecalis]MBS4752740.1 response regulator transcription factor [Nocardioides faecalis]QVI57991.1 response regulator transcription factor [Nocardioides faecalis]
MIRILVADDHPVVRDGVSAMLSAVADFEVVGQADSGPAAVELAAALDPDVVVMDLRMPGGGGVDAVRVMQARGLRAAVLVLTTFDTDADTMAAIEAGATGYLLKDAPAATVVAAVRSTAAGETVLSPTVATRLASHVRRPARSAALSAREREVLVLVARGNSNRAIAKELFVSEATVKTHLGHVYEKLGVADRAAAVAAGYERGILG